ncbi:response regulator transcription factor [Pseudomonas typographi]|uniref:Helix-turn-helix transcriptional regulator n=1 Tax=Pseudomonas typographi TaxID=2715964 RepID=A0ABR7YZI5_9PSED|nr:helix-turn-helix transcriptional regulator [Pseudomonas typographi]MBD1586721.1 helix-turn-helix transcriptional regulator [Pseudomonas typographi]MBD1598615.1 helix-turn-helix transcriptional regulator [Pseudomonas typographi]
MNLTTITAGAWTGFLGKGLAPRELEATAYAASDLTAKEIARLMGITPKSVSKRLDDARFKLGARTVRGLVMEAFKSGLIAAVSCAAPADPDPQQDRDQDHQGVFLA